MTVEFTEQEIKVLLQIMDIAVKAGGLQVAEAAVVLSKKLQLPVVEPVKEAE